MLKCLIFILSLFFLIGADISGVTKVDINKPANDNIGFSLDSDPIVTTKSDNIIKINVAVILPLSGIRQKRGNYLKNALEIIEAQIEGPTGNNDFYQKFDFDLIVFDDGCNEKMAINVAKKIDQRNKNDDLKDDIYFVIGHYCSNTTEASLDIFAEAGVIQITPFSTQSNLTGRSKHFFRLAGRNDRHAEGMGLRMSQFARGGKIAVIYSYESYGRDLSKQISNVLRRNKICWDVQIDLKEAYLARREKRRGICPHFEKDKDYKGIKPQNSAQRLETVAKYLVDNDIKVAYYGGYFPELIILLDHIEKKGKKITFFTGDSVQSDDFWDESYAASDNKMAPLGENVLFSFTRDYSRDVTDRLQNALKRILNKNEQERQRGNRASIQALSGQFAAKDKLFQMRSKFIRGYYEASGYKEFPDLLTLRLFSALQIFQDIIVDPYGQAGHPNIIECDIIQGNNIPITVFDKEKCPDKRVLGKRFIDRQDWVEGISIYMKDYGTGGYSDYVGFETVVGAVNFSEAGEWSNADYHIYRWVNQYQTRKWLEEPEDKQNGGGNKFIGKRGDFMRIF